MRERERKEKKRDMKITERDLERWRDTDNEGEKEKEGVNHGGRCQIFRQILIYVLTRTKQRLNMNK